MPLIKNGEEIANDWMFVADGSALPDHTKVTVSVGRFLALKAAQGNEPGPEGVRLSPEDDPAALEPYLAGLSLIEVAFPKYTDGRGYSQAQLLRRRLGYSGELRAVGHVLRDQIFYMHRSGFDAYETARATVSQVLEALAEFTVAYQPAASGPAAVFRKRHGA
jgi:uncharacterized protein (DUF934 family)